MADATGNPTAAIQDAILGSQALEEGLNKIVINKALFNAEQQVNQINNEITDERQRMQEFTRLGQGLAMKLSGLGMDAAGIEQTVGRLAPSVSSQFQAAENARLQQSSQSFQASEAAKDRGLRREQFTEEKRIRAEEKYNAGMLKLKDKFKADPEVEKNRSAFNLLESADAAFEREGTSKTTEGLYLRGLLKAAGEERLNEGDLKTILYDASRSRAWLRQVGVEVTGDISKDPINYYKKVAAALVAKKKEMMADQLGEFAKSRAKHIGADPTMLASDLAAELDLADVHESRKHVAQLPSIWRARLKSNIPPEDAEVLVEMSKMSKEELRATPEALGLLKKYNLMELK